MFASKASANVCGAVLAATVVIACCKDIHVVTAHTCLECRATLTTRTICGVAFRSVSQDAYSMSVITGEPSHQHHWKWCGYCDGWSLTGTSHAWGRRHAIWNLPVQVHKEYAGLVSPADLQKTLVEIDSADRTKADEAVARVYDRVLQAR